MNISLLTASLATAGAQRFVTSYGQHLHSDFADQEVARSLQQGGGPPREMPMGGAGEGPPGKEARQVDAPLRTEWRPISSSHNPSTRPLPHVLPAPSSVDHPSVQIGFCDHLERASFLSFGLC